MSAGRQALWLVVLGGLLGVAIWVFSPWLTGKVEPWDAEAPIWSLSWLAVAVAGGLTGRVRGVGLPIGYALGQMLITIKSVFVGQFGPLGWMFIAGYATVAVALALILVGATVAARRLRRRHRR